MVSINKCFLSLSLLLGMLTYASAGNVPFEMVKGLMIVEARVDGLTGRYIFDTGADHFILDSRHNGPKDLTIHTGSGEAKGSSLQIEKISIGEVNKGKVDAAVMDLTNLDNFLGFDVKGIMPGKIFDPHYVEIDYSSHNIIISDKISKEERNQFTHKWKIENFDRIALVKTKIDQEEVYFILDSGASTTYLSLKTIESIAGSLPTGNSNNTVTTEGTAISREFFIPEFTIEDFTVQNLKVFELDTESLSKAMGKNIQGIINLKFLSNTNILFDFRRNLVYF